MTGRQWIAAINVLPGIYVAQEVRGGRGFRYWEQRISAPKGTRVICYPGVDFGLGRYHCFPSLKVFKEYCEHSKTMSCSCGGVCAKVQLIRQRLGLAKAL